MKKALLIFIGITELMVGNAAMGAVSIKKSAPVTTSTSSGGTGIASLAPTVLSLVSGVMELNKAQKELTAECIPSSQEIAFVDATVKEWAKTGAMTPDEVARRLNRTKCLGGSGYRASVELEAGTQTGDICYDYYTEKDVIWSGYPKVGTASYCADGSYNCKNKKHKSDIYDIFNLIDFSEADYATAQEITMAGKLMAKMETCSYAKLSAKKKAMWGDFLVNTVSNVGQSTNTGDIMQAVSGITSSLGNGGGLGGLSSIGAIATQFLDK